MSRFAKLGAFKAQISVLAGLSLVAAGIISANGAYAETPVSTFPDLTLANPSPADKNKREPLVDYYREQQSFSNNSVADGLLANPGEDPQGNVASVNAIYDPWKKEIKWQIYYNAVGEGFEKSKNWFVLDQNYLGQPEDITIRDYYHLNQQREGQANPYNYKIRGTAIQDGKERVFDNKVFLLTEWEIANGAAWTGYNGGEVKPVDPPVPQYPNTKSTDTPYGNMSEPVFDKFKTDPLRDVHVEKSSEALALDGSDGAKWVLFSNKATEQINNGGRISKNDLKNDLVGNGDNNVYVFETSRSQAFAAIGNGYPDQYEINFTTKVIDDNGQLPEQIMMMAGNKSYQSSLVKRRGVAIKLKKTTAPENVLYCYNYRYADAPLLTKPAEGDRPAEGGVLKSRIPLADPTVEAPFSAKGNPAEAEKKRNILNWILRLGYPYDGAGLWKYLKEYVDTRSAYTFYQRMRINTRLSGENYFQDEYFSLDDYFDATQNAVWHITDNNDLEPITDEYRHHDNSPTNREYTNPDSNLSIWKDNPSEWMKRFATTPKKELVNNISQLLVQLATDAVAGQGLGKDKETIKPNPEYEAFFYPNEGETEGKDGKLYQNFIGLSPTNDLNADITFAVTKTFKSDNHNAYFELSGNDGKAPKSFTVEANSKAKEFTLENLVPERVYTLTEKYAPDGQAVIDPIKFKVVPEFQIFRDYLQGNAADKRNYTGTQPQRQMKPTGNYDLYIERKKEIDGKVVSVWEKQVSKILSVNSTETDESKKLALFNGDANISFQKIDAQTGKTITGAEFTLTPENGDQNGTASFGGDSAKPVSVSLNRTYILEETKTPEGYINPGKRKLYVDYYKGLDTTGKPIDVMRVLLYGENGNLISINQVDPDKFNETVTVKVPNTKTDNVNTRVTISPAANYTIRRGYEIPSNLGFKPVSSNFDKSVIIPASEIYYETKYDFDTGIKEAQKIADIENKADQLGSFKHFQFDIKDRVEYYGLKPEAYTVYSTLISTDPSGNSKVEATKTTTLNIGNDNGTGFVDIVLPNVPLSVQGTNTTSGLLYYVNQKIKSADGKEIYHVGRNDKSQAFYTSLNGKEPELPKSDIATQIKFVNEAGKAFYSTDTSPLVIGENEFKKGKLYDVITNDNGDELSNVSYNVQTFILKPDKNDFEKAGEPVDTVTTNKQIEVLIPLNQFNTSPSTEEVVNKFIDALKNKNMSILNKVFENFNTGSFRTYFGSSAANLKSYYNNINDYALSDYSGLENQLRNFISNNQASIKMLGDRMGMNGGLSLGTYVIGEQVGQTRQHKEYTDKKQTFIIVSDGQKAPEIATTVGDGNNEATKEAALEVSAYKGDTTTLTDTVTLTNLIKGKQYYLHAHVIDLNGKKEIPGTYKRIPYTAGDNKDGKQTTTVEFELTLPENGNFAYEVEEILLPANDDTAVIDNFKDASAKVTELGQAKDLKGSEKGAAHLHSDAQDASKSQVVNFTVTETQPIVATQITGAKVGTEPAPEFAKDDLCDAANNSMDYIDCLTGPTKINFHAAKYTENTSATAVIDTIAYKSLAPTAYSVQGVLIEKTTTNGKTTGKIVAVGTVQTLNQNNETGGKTEYSFPAIKLAADKEYVAFEYVAKTSDLPKDTTILNETALTSGENNDLAPEELKEKILGNLNIDLQKVITHADMNDKAQTLQVVPAPKTTIDTTVSVNGKTDPTRSMLFYPVVPGGENTSESLAWFNTNLYNRWLKDTVTYQNLPQNTEGYIAASIVVELDTTTKEWKPVKIIAQGSENINNAGNGSVTVNIKDVSMYKLNGQDAPQQFAKDTPYLVITTIYPKSVVNDNPYRLGGDAEKGFYVDICVEKGDDDLYCKPSNTSNTSGTSSTSDDSSVEFDPAPEGGDPAEDDKQPKGELQETPPVDNPKYVATHGGLDTASQQFMFFEQKTPTLKTVAEINGKQSSDKESAVSTDKNVLIADTVYATNLDKRLDYSVISVLYDKDTAKPVFYSLAQSPTFTPAQNTTDGYMTQTPVGHVTKELKGNKTYVYYEYLLSQVDDPTAEVIRKNFNEFNESTQENKTLSGITIPEPAQGATELAKGETIKVTLPSTNEGGKNTEKSLAILAAHTNLKDKAQTVIAQGEERIVPVKLELPATGGIGHYIYYLLAGALFALAYRQRQKTH